MKKKVVTNKIQKVFDLETKMFLSFHPQNADSQKYIVVEKSLPRIDGLKRKRNRMRFTVELIDELQKNGISIYKKGIIKHKIKTQNEKINLRINAFLN